MSDPWKPPGPSAFDDNEWPEQLVARAIEPDPVDDRLHGYAVVGDLARNTHFSDVLYLAITGELPAGTASDLFELALCSLATPSVAEAPTHVAILTRLASGPVASALGAGLVTAAADAQHLVASHGELLVWLDAPTETVPETYRGNDAWAATLREAVARIDPAEDRLRAEMSRDAARITLLYLAGVRSADHQIAAIVAARVAGISAEALLTGPQHLGTYPVGLPPFRYVEG